MLSRDTFTLRVLVCLCYMITTCIAWKALICWVKAKPQPKLDYRHPMNCCLKFLQQPSQEYPDLQLTLFASILQRNAQLQLQIFSSAQPTQFYFTALRCILLCSVPPHSTLFSSDLCYSALCYSDISYFALL